MHTKIIKQGGGTTNLKKRFFLWSGIIIMGGGLILSIASYWNTRRVLIAEAMSKSKVMLMEVEAIRSYVKDELRPKMVDLHGKDSFIIEAMSTTYVSNAIMRRFARTMPDHVYRRASTNPHNPENTADSFEERMLEWFEADKERKLWQGVVKKNRESYFISMAPDYFIKACIRCHGKVEDAPVSLVERYGPDGGFRFEAGELAGINSVAIPVSSAMREALQSGLVMFLITLSAAALWVWLVNMLFQHLVIERLSTMLSLVSDQKKEEAGAASGDELDRLKASLGSLSDYVRSARKGSRLEPNFIGEYVVTQPITAGAVSWIYQASSVTFEEKVFLKVGFDDVLRNPLYLSCLDTELSFFEDLSHSCLPKVQKRLDNVLVLDPFSDTSLLSLFKGKPLPEEQVRALFKQLCDLIACFHANGIVHHDLRPEIILMDDGIDDKVGSGLDLKLYDMGLASSDQRQDPITAAGLTPQGDPQYMAPEQLKGQRGDPRSDIYAAGVLLYLAVTGRFPFEQGPKAPQKWLKLKERIPEPERHCHTVSSHHFIILKKALAFDVKKRYQWIEDFRDDLLNDIDKTGVDAVELY